MGDRLQFAPNHEGDFVLPCNTLFTNLFSRAHQPAPNLAVRDVNANLERTFAQLLSDVVHLRNCIKSSLSQRCLHDIVNGEEIYISLIASGGYEFAVGALAILAAGAAISPISLAQPVDEAVYYVTKSRSIAVLTSSAAYKKGELLTEKIRSLSNIAFVHIPISGIFDKPPISPSSLHISSTNTTSPDKPALVIFTSGTSGPPKGGVLRFGTVTDTSLVWASGKDIKSSDTLLHVLPVHHATGIWVCFFPFLLAGACIEFRSGSFDPEWTWNRWCRDGITYFSGVPTIYMRMMRYYTQIISKLPRREKLAFDTAAQKLKVCLCGTSALPRSINDFWTKILGKRIIQRYGSTELGVIFEMPLHGSDDVPDGSVGLLIPGVDLKLIDDDGRVGDEGEVSARSPHMFSKYLFDPVTTKAAHDQDGYFKSGDIARREGKYYFIVGRASVDIIKSGGYKISALDIEREMLALPYIGEAMVVGVPDDEYGQRVGAVISLRNDDLARDYVECQGRQLDDLKLDDLRADLRIRLAGYKLPTLLRVIKGELPKNGTGKVVKKTLGPQYFPSNYGVTKQVQVWNGRKALDSKI